MSLSQEQTTAIGAVLSPVIVGLAAVAGFRHESLERRHERRQEFQRDAIIALQDSAWDFRGCVLEATNHVRMPYQEIRIRKEHGFTPADRTELFMQTSRPADAKGLESRFGQAHISDGHL